jgi:hypothetical protein
MKKTDSGGLYYELHSVRIPCDVGFRVRVKSKCASYAKRIACLPL